MDNIEGALAAFKLMSFSGMIDGGLRLVKIVNDLPLAFGDCKEASSSTMDKLTKFKARFSSMWGLSAKMSTNMLSKGSRIFGEVTDGMNDYNNSDFFNEGVHFGRALELLTA